MPRSMSALDQRDECMRIADEVSKIKDDVETGGIEIRFKWICRPIGAVHEFIYLKYLRLGKNRLTEMKNVGIL